MGSFDALHHGVPNPLQPHCQSGWGDVHFLGDVVDRVIVGVAAFLEGPLPRVQLVETGIEGRSLQIIANSCPQKNALAFVRFRRPVAEFSRKF